MSLHIIISLICLNFWNTKSLCNEHTYTLDIRFPTFWLVPTLIPSEPMKSIHFLKYFVDISAIAMQKKKKSEPK